MKKPLLAAALLSVISSAALAQANAQQPADEPVTKAALTAKLDTDFTDLDSNKDGKASSAEIEARVRKGAEADLAELRKQRDATFASIDTDKNGSISRAEFDARAKLPAIPAITAKPFLDRFDANKDVSISKEEFRAPTMANFARLDVNKDGTVSVAEQQAAEASLRKAATTQNADVGR